MALSALSLIAPGLTWLAELNNLSIYSPKASKLLTSYAPITAIFANILILIGLAVLIDKLMINPVDKYYELEQQKEKLYASNYILSETLSYRDQELESNAQQMRKVLSESHISRLALIKSERKFRTLFDESPAIFASVDKQLILTDINAFGARSLGYDSLKLLGKCFSKIASAKDQLDIEIFIANFFSETNPIQQTEARLVREDKSEIWVKITGSLISQNQSEKHLLLVCQDISTLKGLEDKLSFHARHDPLTGLLNRYALEDILQNLLETCGDHNKSSLAFMYFDVDQLKVVNDTCGHVAGDELLKQLTQQIQHHLPSVDCFARIGGDEFAVIKANTNEEKATEIAALIRNAAEDFVFVWNGKSFRHSVSIGVTLSSNNICTPTAIIGASDAACYAAKQAGRNRVILFGDMEARLGNSGEMAWVSRLQEALVKDRFELYFQPIVPLDNLHSSYIHYEMLVRYVDENGKHQAPELFLPAAERFGLADQIDLWVLTSALDFLDKHPNHTKKLNYCSINLTSHSLASYRTRSAVRQLLSSINFPTSKICFEITETSAISNLSEVADFIKDLKLLGCRFALDDFGTGFSSFGYLKRLDVDYIKIDGSFIRDITVDGIDRAIVTAINSIGHEMGIEVVAEYVENNTILKELSALNISYGQGYGLARPMPISEIERHYSAREQSFRLLSSAT